MHPNFPADFLGPFVLWVGTTPILKKNALGVKRPFSEQLSEFRAILGAILGMALTT